MGDYSLSIRPLSRQSLIKTKRQIKTTLTACKLLYQWNNIVDVAVNFLFQLIFVFPLFLGMYANEFETKEKQKLTEIKNKLQHWHEYKYYKQLLD